MLHPDDYYRLIYDTLRRQANGDVQQAAVLPQAQQHPRPVTVTESIAQTEQQSLQQQGSSNAPQSNKFNFKDLILPIVAGAIAGISPKAATAVGIASQLYGNIRRLNQDKAMSESQLSDKRLAQMRLDAALGKLRSGNLTPQQAAIELLGAGVSANDIPRLLQNLYGMSVEDATAAMANLPPGVSARIPIGGAGGELSTSVNYQIGSPRSELVYDPDGKAVKVVTVMPPARPGDEPRVTITPIKGVPPNAADDVMRTATATAAGAQPSGKQRWKPVQIIDQETGMPSWATLDTFTGNIVKTPFPAPPSGATSPYAGMNAQVNMLATLVDAMNKAIQNGDVATAKKIEAMISSLIGTGTTGQNLAIGGGSLSPEDEANAYLAKRRGGKH